MLNYPWAGMMIVGIPRGALHDQFSAMTEGTLQPSGEAVTLYIAMLEVMPLWAGVLEIGHRSGPADQLAGRISSSLIFLLPRLFPQGEARKQIATNMIANILGSGWATIPAGIRTMEELKKVEEGRGKYGGGAANNETRTFLIIGISSLQPVPMNMIAYRSQYGSVNPIAIVEPMLVAMFLSTVVVVISCKAVDRKRSP